MFLTWPCRLCLPKITRPEDIQTAELAKSLLLCIHVMVEGHPYTDDLDSPVPADRWFQLLTDL